MPTRDAVGRTRSPFYGPDCFTYLPESNSYICPAGQQLNYGGRNEGNRTFGYIGTRKKCGPCQQRSQCTTGPFRYLAIHMNEAARQRARDLRTTPEFERTQRQRKKVEALFAELKSNIESPSSALARVEVRPRAVLPGGHRPEHQTTGPVPRPAKTTTGTCHCLDARKENTPRPRATHQLQNTGKDTDFFNTHRASHSLSYSERSVSSACCRITGYPDSSRKVGDFIPIDSTSSPSPASAPLLSAVGGEPRGVSVRIGDHPGRGQRCRGGWSRSTERELWSLLPR